MADKFTSLKFWEKCSPPPVASASGSFLITGGQEENEFMYVASSTLAYMYSAKIDGWSQIESPALSGTFGPGSCGVYHPRGLVLTCINNSGIGTTFNLNGDVASEFRTSISLKVNLGATTSTGKRITGYCLSGNNIGAKFVVVGNTTGPNSKIFLQTPGGAYFAHSPGDVLVFYTGRYYVLNAGTVSAGSFKYYDYATQTWSSNLSVTNLPGSWGTGGAMAHTYSYGIYNGGTVSYNGSTSSNIYYPGVTLVANRWVNCVLTGIGGINNGVSRVIVSNDTSSYTVSPAFPNTPGNFESYYVFGNEDIIYLTGNNSVNMYTYVPSTNTWALLSPGTARTGAPGAGSNLTYKFNSSNIGGLLLNLTQLVSMRGDGSNELDIYNLNGTWESVSYGRQVEVINKASWVGDDADGIYGNINPVVGTQPRFFKYDLGYQALMPFGVIPTTLGTVVDGNKVALMSSWKNNVLQARFLYYLMPSAATMYRVEVYNIL